MTETPVEYCNGCRVEHALGNHLKLDDVERIHIITVFEATGRNVMRTADILDISRSTLHTKLDRYGLRVQRTG